MLVNPQGFDFLGSATITAAAASLPSIAIDPYDLLIFQIRHMGGSGAGGIGLLQFNGDAVAANYYSRFITLSNVAAPVVADVSNTALTGIATGPAVITGDTRSIFVYLAPNLAALQKTMSIQSAESVATQATVPQVVFGMGAWLNTAARISAVQFVASAANLVAGTGMAVFGKNL